MNIAVISMDYMGIPCAALLADVPGFNVTGAQQRSERSGWKLESLNSGKAPFEGDEPGLRVDRAGGDRKEELPRHRRLCCVPGH